MFISNNIFIPNVKLVDTAYLGADYSDDESTLINIENDFVRIRFCYNADFDRREVLIYSGSSSSFVLCLDNFNRSSSAGSSISYTVQNTGSKLIGTCEDAGSRITPKMEVEFYKYV